MMNNLIVIIARYLVIIIGIIAVIATILSEKPTRNNIIKLAVISFVIVILLAFIIGLFYYNPRPFVIDNIEPLIPHEADNGFPSHHTLAALVTAATIFVYRRRLGIILGILGICVGIARVASGLHYPIDIIGSLLIAAVAVFCAWVLLRKLGQRLKPISNVTDFSIRGKKR